MKRNLLSRIIGTVYELPRITSWIEIVESKIVTGIHNRLAVSAIEVIPVARIEYELLEVEIKIESFWNDFIKYTDIVGVGGERKLIIQNTHTMQQVSFSFNFPIIILILIVMSFNWS